MASGVSSRKHFPGMTAWMGSVPWRTASSIRWICTGEVWVRSSTVSGSPMSRYMVSYMPRAGWAGGMLSASKLYQSVSASGPSATSKPMPDEDVLELVAGLGHQVEVAPASGDLT